MAWALRRLGHHYELPKRPPPLVARRTHRRISAGLPQRRAGSVLVRAWFGFGSVLVRSWFCFGSLPAALPRALDESGQDREPVSWFCFGSGPVLFWFGRGSEKVVVPQADSTDAA